MYLSLAGPTLLLLVQTYYRAADCCILAQTKLPSPANNRPPTTLFVSTTQHLHQFLSSMSLESPLWRVRS